MNLDRSHPGRRSSRRAWSLGLVAAVLLAAGLVAPHAGAAPPTTDPPTAAGYGARWLAARVTPDGYVADGNGDPSPGRTVSTALALAAAGVEGDAFARAYAWISTHVDAYVVVGGEDSAGGLGYLLLLVDAAGGDPTDVGGTNLVSRLQATLGDFETGLYGASDPTYDGATRQGLAILGLEASGVAPAGSAVTWLIDQQCGAAPAPAAGGWQPSRADTSQPCVAPDPVNFVGPDTNSTAFAVEALASTGSPLGSGLEFLQSSQASDGGFAFVPGGDVDPNSTALVIQSLVAAGEDPAASPWASGETSPYASLLSWQLGCDQAVADVGAFASPFSDGGPDDYATEQAVWGASEHAFPLGEVSFGSAPVPCTSPRGSTISTTTTGPPTTADRAVAAAVAALVTTPTFTG